jgi:hypothetical protein
MKLLEEEIYMEEKFYLDLIHLQKMGLDGINMIFLILMIEKNLLLEV